MAVPMSMITKNFVAPAPPMPPPEIAPALAAAWENDAPADPVMVNGYPVRLAVIPLAKIKPPKDASGKYLNPRRVAPMPLEGLVESMRVGGQEKPIHVFAQDDQYFLMDGDRRVQAARKLGWTDIVAIVIDKPVTDERIRESMLLSDVRQHLPPSAVAASIVAMQLSDPVRWTETRLASFLGKPASAIPVLIALASAPESVRKAVDTFESTGGASGMSLTAFKQLMNRPKAQQADITERALEAAAKKGKAVTVDQVRKQKAEVLGESGAMAGLGLLDNALAVNPAFDHLNEAAAYISQHGQRMTTAERAQLGTAARSVLAALEALRAK